ncbi:coniferyl aldehyde dehydrogenase [Paracoccus pantotrophus]|uniref:coniferyl aldehyde dehydrogenase n=1 Tax=Paracoccus pantotrophus TaxID=82367 RepID=UPI00049089AC|nr:coniferyl aldehyde dehydrogenase [Paracoccus pantotrophus]
MPDPEMTAVLERQRQAFLTEGAPDIGMRRDRLARLRKATLAHRRDLARAISADFSHRSAHESDLLELMVVVQAIDYLQKNLRRFMRPQKRHVAPTYRAGRAWVEYQPKGIIGIMAPWNYPVSLVLIPLATALAAGNRAMLKPSELTQRTSALLRDMLAEAFPEDEVAVILGGPEVGAAFSRLPFDHLLFTGSTPVGRKVMQTASENLVPLTLELGGKSPAIIAPGQVNRRTMEGLTFGKLSNGGQTCVAPDYALVHRDDLDAFRAAYEETVRRFYPAGPTSPDYTAIINDRHFARLNGLLEDAKTKGAEIIPVGHRPDSAASRPQTIAPTLVLNAGDDCAVMQDEIFGPILPVRSYETMDEVIAFVNARPRPLALYYFGPRDAECGKLLAQTTSGNVCINATMMHVAQDDLPFGGIGPSGMGAYHGPEGFRAMSHAKGIYAQGRWNPARLLHAPFGRFAKLAARLNLR